MAGMDVGFENPMFACLEMDYEEADNDPTGEATQAAQQVWDDSPFYQRFIQTNSRRIQLD